MLPSGGRPGLTLLGRAITGSRSTPLPLTFVRPKSPLLLTVHELTNSARQGPLVASSPRCSTGNRSSPVGIVSAISPFAPSLRPRTYRIAPHRPPPAHAHPRHPRHPVPARLLRDRLATESRLPARAALSGEEALPGTVPECEPARDRSARAVLDVQPGEADQRCGCSQPP